MSEPSAAATADTPYPGLRPYEETEQHQFFGRDNDTQILLDKILTHRLTLLFAATGVGKSSLLKASVIPELNATSGKHLDVVYYKDWVTAPLDGLKAEIRKTVEQSDNWPQGTVLDESLELAEFIQFCTLFVRPPLVIMLDQFEELFRYRHKYHGETFQPFIDQLTGLITATHVPVSVVFSMREDFALELNAFKPKLPTLLFENYYRLERLPAKAAKQAIVEPLRDFQFSYEPELLKQLLQDLLKHDPDRGLSSLGEDDETETVIPPQLQIVCSQLWQRECDNPDRMLHLATYEKAGRAEGLLKNYVEESLKGFNEKDRRVLSRAFDHLVSIQGTKMPHTVATLAEKISFNAVSWRHTIWWIANRISRVFRFELPDSIARMAPNDADATESLQKIMDKLASQDVRILRSQRREQKTWYELYHDMYSESINAWNRVQKRKMLWRQVRIWGSAISAVVLVAFFGTVAYVHSVSHHLRLAPGDDNRVEIFTGRHGWVDPFGQKRFYAETDLFSREIEPDKRFIARGVLDYKTINTGLIVYQPLEERVLAYIYAGSYVKVLELFDQAIKSGGNQSSTVLRGLFNLRNQLSFDKIKSIATSPQNTVINKTASELFQENITSLPLENLVAFKPYLRILKQKYVVANHKSASPLLLNQLINYLSNSNQTIRGNAASFLGQIGDAAAIPHLAKALSDHNEIVRRDASTALSQISSAAAIPHLAKAISDDSDDVRRTAFMALSQIGDDTAIPHFTKAINSENEHIRVAAAVALGHTGSATATPYLIKALADDNKYVRQHVVEALGKIGNADAIPYLIKALADDNKYVRQYAIEALGKIGNADAIPYLTKLNATSALGKISDVDAIPHFTKAITSKNDDLRLSAAVAFGRIGDATAVPHLVKALADDNEYVRINAAAALEQIGDTTTIPYLIKALADDNEYVRINAAVALGQMGDAAATPHLVKAINNGNRFYNSKAAETLIKISNSTVIQHLVKAIDNGNKNVRSNAASILIRIGAGKHARTAQPDR